MTGTGAMGCGVVGCMFSHTRGLGWEPESSTLAHSLDSRIAHTHTHSCRDYRGGSSYGGGYDSRDRDRYDSRDRDRGYGGGRRDDYSSRGRDRYYEVSEWDVAYYTRGGPCCDAVAPSEFASPTGR